MIDHEGVSTSNLEFLFCKLIIPTLLLSYYYVLVMLWKHFCDSNETFFCIMWYCSMIVQFFFSFLFLFSCFGWLVVWFDYEYGDHILSLDIFTSFWQGKRSLGVHFYFCAFIVYSSFLFVFPFGKHLAENCCPQVYGCVPRGL